MKLMHLSIATGVGLLAGILIGTEIQVRSSNRQLRDMYVPTDPAFNASRDALMRIHRTDPQRFAKMTMPELLTLIKAESIGSASS